jgi:DNA ligase (NAD+)
LKFDNLGQKSIEKIYDSNIRTIKQFYNLSIKDILQLEGYKQKSAEKLFNSINSRKETITCLEYMVASKCFDEGLGMKTLKKIIEVYGEDDVPLQKLIDLEDVGESRAKSYKSGLGKFKKFIESNGLTCKKTESKVVNNDKGKFKNKFVVFSGFRDEKLQNMIESEGGTIQNTINSKTTMLVIKKESASSKVKQAKEMNIEIMTKDQFELKYKL